MQFQTITSSAALRCGQKAVVALAASILSFAAASDAQAELLVGLTRDNNLISFDSATPGTITSTNAVTGIIAGDTLVGIDRRPQALGLPNTALPGPNNNRIYALGVNAGGAGRIYTINEATGLATPGALLIADPADASVPTPFTTVAGTSFGFDFNPVPDRLRVTSNTGQNLRINVDNGLVQLDVPLSFVAMDINSGDVPFDIAVAYSNNFGGATTTVLRGVDIGQNPDALVVHSNPNGGTLSTLLNLPFDSTFLTAYDISGLTGTPYFSATTIGGSGSTLFSGGPGGINQIGSIGGGAAALVGLAAPVGAPIPEPGTALVGLALCGIIGGARRRRA